MPVHGRSAQRSYSRLLGSFSIATRSKKPLLKPVDTWLDYQTLFSGHLEAINRSSTTIRTYNVALDQLRDFLRPQGVLSPLDVTRDHMTAWLIHLQKPDPVGRGLAPASVAQRYRSIQAFFKFMVNVEGMEKSPLDKLPQPRVPESLVPVVDEKDLQRLLDALRGRTFEDRRDRAIVSLLIDTGVRLAEIAGLDVGDVDMDGQQITVLGKGRKVREIRFVKATKMDLQRYLMERRHHPDEDEPAFWLGRRGVFGPTGIHQMLRRRCEQVGLPPIHAHQFRHTFAHLYLLNGGNEGDLMRITGWTTRAMVDRYGRSAGAARAKAAHSRFSPRQLMK